MPLMVIIGIPLRDYSFLSYFYMLKIILSKKLDLVKKTLDMFNTCVLNIN